MNDKILGNRLPSL